MTSAYQLVGPVRANHCTTIPKVVVNNENSLVMGLYTFTITSIAIPEPTYLMGMPNNHWFTDTGQVAKS